MGKTQKHKNTPSTFQKIHLQVYLIFDYIMKVLEYSNSLTNTQCNPMPWKEIEYALKIQNLMQY
jgi:hypothetical protein